jgi:4-azaleucine resistance transporter AzlC
MSEREAALDVDHASKHHATHSFTRGLKSGLPIFLGYLPVGAAFGVVARSTGFSIAQAVSCSALALAGAGQFIGLSLYSSGATVLAVLVASTVVNLRYVLFGATLVPLMRGIGLPAQAGLAFFLTDETYAVNVLELRAGRATAASMFGVGAIAWSGWVLGTTVGAIAGSAIGDPSAYGLQYAMPAMFTALLVGLVEDRSPVVTAAIAGAFTLFFAAVLPGSWYLVLAALVAATVATVVFE